MQFVHSGQALSLQLGTIAAQGQKTFYGGYDDIDAKMLPLIQSGGRVLSFKIYSKELPG